MTECCSGPNSNKEAYHSRSDSAVTVPFNRQDADREIARAAQFLISNESSYINAQRLFFDGDHMVGIVRSQSA
jgi:NAD(P)-dependent dehydrogenase (short-subunit alcohol dehydrogenase family)